jgi:hypothetical protein
VRRVQLGWFTHVAAAGSPRATVRDTIATQRVVMRTPELGPVAALAAAPERVR